MELNVCAVDSIADCWEMSSTIGSSVLGLVDGMTEFGLDDDD